MPALSKTDSSAKKRKGAITSGRDAVNQFMDSIRLADIPVMRPGQKRSGSMQCGLYAIWNYIGRSDFVTAADMRTQVLIMENKEWFAQRKTFLLQHCTGMKKPPSKALMKQLLADNMSVGGLNGSWTLNALSDCLGNAPT